MREMRRQPTPGGAAFALLLTLVSGRAATLQDVLDEARAASGAPGASAAIMQNGTLIWRGSSGVARIDSGLPVSDSTLYSLASVTKTFTSTMILRLSEEGKLGLNDFIAPYVPSYMPSTGVVTVHDLLGMTSGYQDVEGYPVILKWLADPNHRWARSQILDRVQPVKFAPGSRFQYSNTNYVILGGMIDSVSAAGIAGEFERLIVQPAGIAGEAYFVRDPAAAGRMAHGYNLQRAELVDTFAGADSLGVPTSVWGVMWTDGGLAATASGVAGFTDALFGGRILEPATLAVMIQPGPNGSYGLGTRSIQFDGFDWQGNDGFYDGFTTVTMYDFSRQLTITVLTNYTDNATVDHDAAYAIWYRLVKAYDAANAGL
jgi:D-alanyl-D-alanine carboxypeptidase